CAHVGLACPLGVAPQQHRRIMPTTRRYDVYGHTSIQEGRLVAPTEIMESDSGSHCCLPSRSICGCQKNFTRRSKFEAASTGHSPKKKSISELPKWFEVRMTLRQQKPLSFATSGNRRKLSHTTKRNLLLLWLRLSGWRVRR